jgi:hypothetical protein
MILESHRRESHDEIKDSDRSHTTLFSSLSRCDLPTNATLYIYSSLRVYMSLFNISDSKYWLCWNVFLETQLKLFSYYILFGILFETGPDRRHVDYEWVTRGFLLSGRSCSFPNPSSQICFYESGIVQLEFRVMSHRCYHACVLVSRVDEIIHC